MKQKRYTAEQIVYALRQAEAGVKVVAVNLPALTNVDANELTPLLSVTMPPPLLASMVFDTGGCTMMGSARPTRPGN